MQRVLQDLSRRAALQPHRQHKPGNAKGTAGLGALAVRSCERMCARAMCAWAGIGQGTHLDRSDARARRCLRVPNEAQSEHIEESGAKAFRRHRVLKCLPDDRAVGEHEAQLVAEWQDRVDRRCVQWPQGDPCAASTIRCRVNDSHNEARRDLVPARIAPPFRRLMYSPEMYPNLR
jgi:hypothetical protein